MEKHYCKKCGKITLFFMNFPENFAKKKVKITSRQSYKTKQVCSECWTEL